MYNSEYGSFNLLFAFDFNYWVQTKTVHFIFSLFAIIFLCIFIFCIVLNSKFFDVL